MNTIIPLNGEMPALDLAGQAAYEATTQRGLVGRVGEIVKCEFPPAGKGRGRFYAVLKNSGLATQSPEGQWTMSTSLAKAVILADGVFKFVVMTNTPLVRIAGTTQYAQCSAEEPGAILVVNTVSAVAPEPSVAEEAVAEEAVAEEAVAEEAKVAEAPVATEAKAKAKKR